MADKNISQLTALTGEGINRTNDQVAVWDADATTTKKVAAQDFVTTGLQDPTGATTTRVNKVVALNQAAYGAIGTPDSETLYVITDGKTKDSYTGQIDTPEDRTYIIDPKVVSARDISGFYCTWTEGASPAGTIDLQVGGTTVLSATHTIASGTTTFTGSIVSNGTEVITDAEVASGTTITLVLSGSTADITNFAFVVEYQS